MTQADPRQTLLSLLVLRHLVDGDAIEWPVPDDLPAAPVFRALETAGHVARWDRIWPLSDRYKMTDSGAALIARFYRPEGAEEFFGRIRSLPAGSRAEAVANAGFDPSLWPSLHDPHTHYLTWIEDPGPWHRIIWEPPPRPATPYRSAAPRPRAAPPRPAARPQPSPSPRARQYPPRGPWAGNMGSGHHFNNPAHHGQHDVIVHHYVHHYEHEGFVYDDPFDAFDAGFQAGELAGAAADLFDPPDAGVDVVDLDRGGDGGSGDDGSASVDVS